MRVLDVIEHELFQRARVRTASVGLQREVSWVHVVDQPDPASWVRQGQLVLTTGRGITGNETHQRTILRELAEVGVAGVVLAVPTYFDAFPENMVEAGMELELPLIEIPWEVPFVGLTEALHRIILNEQYQVIEASERIHSSLTRAAVSFRGLNDLADTLGELLGRSVVIETADGSVLSYYKQNDEDSIRAITIATGRSAPAFDEYIKTLGLDSIIGKASGPLRVPGTLDDEIAARVVCPVHLLDEHVGYVWIIEGKTPLSELDLRAAEHAATVAALHLSHQRDLLRTEHRLGATLLDALLELEGEPSSGLIERAHLMGIKGNQPWRLVQITLPFPLPLTEADLRDRDQIAVRWQNRLLDDGNPTLVTTHLQNIIALTSDKANVQRLAQEEGLTRHRVLVSGPGQHMGEVRARYLDLKAMQPHVGETGVYAHEELLIPRVLSGDRAAAREFVTQMLGGLERIRGGDTLRETLGVVSEQGFNLKASAQYLGIHISTLRYRIERIEDLLGHDINNPKTRFLLQLCFELLTFREPA